MEVFCYLIYDEETGEGILIDPAGDEDRLLELLKEHKVRLRYIVNTHGHADHTCGNDRLREATGGVVVMHVLDDLFFQKPEIQEWSRTLGFNPSGRVDIQIEDGDELTFGGITMKFLHTPGHTPGACCILIDGNLFTGDTLFVGAAGRTDLPGSSFAQLIESLMTKILRLPPETVIWPGHDYGDRPHSILRREMQTNPYLTDFAVEDE
jgi:glyoxylase-like metal-dependent hydrolase (beta-lactamase superfamily II)